MTAPRTTRFVASTTLDLVECSAHAQLSPQAADLASALLALVGRELVAPAAGAAADPVPLLPAVVNAVVQACGLAAKRPLVVACELEADRRNVVEREVADAPGTVLAMRALAAVLREQQPCQFAVAIGLDGDTVREVFAGLEGEVDVEVSTCQHLDDVLRAAGLIDAAETTAFWSAATARRACAWLFPLVCENRVPLLRWASVARLAYGALRAPGLDDTERWQLGFIRDVSRRHAGEGVLISWPQSHLAALPLEKRLEVIAHLVQSSADGAIEQIEAYVALAHEAVGEHRSPAALKVLGACGRALGALLHTARAGELLAQAVQGWLALGRAAEAGYSLCERLRLLGQERALEEVQKVVAIEVSEFEAAEPDERSRTYVCLAVGRALIQAGASGEGLGWLAQDTADWMDGDAHVRTARLRWRAFAHGTLGDEASVQTTLQGFEDERLSGDGQRALAELDRALRRGLSPTEALNALLADANDGPEARRCMTALAPEVRLADWPKRSDLLERLAWTWRY